MAEAPRRTARAGWARWKVLYLLAVVAVTFAVPAVEATRPAQWYVVAGLLTAQVLALRACGAGLGEVGRAVTRLKWLFLFLLLCYTLLPADSHSLSGVVYPWRPPGTTWTVSLHLSGLARAGLMCLQLLTVILASAVVRLSGSETDLADGLRSLGLPRLFVHSFDQTLALFGGLPRRAAGANNRTGENAVGVGEAAPRLWTVLGRLVRGDVDAFLQFVRRNLDRAWAEVAANTAGRLDPRLAHDVAILTGVALAMLSLKMVKVLPGVAFAPGIKTVLLFPLYVLAARQTRSRWGGTSAGALLGAFSFLQGDGRYGVLDLPQHIAPGLVIDLAMPVVRRLPPSALVYCALGFLAAVARTSTELAVVLLLGARAEVYLFLAAKLVSNLTAGTLSGFVSVLLVRAFPDVPENVPSGENKPIDLPNDDRIRPLDREAVESSPPQPLSPGPRTGDGLKRSNDVV